MDRKNVVSLHSPQSNPVRTTWVNQNDVKISPQRTKDLVCDFAEV